MKDFKFVFLIITLIAFQSCTPDEGTPRPTSGENSFTAKINGEQFIAVDIWKFKRIDHGITAYENGKTWLLSFRNSSKTTIYFYLPDIEGVDYYNVGVADDNLSFFDNRDTQTSVLMANSNSEVIYNSNSPDLNEKITIKEVQGDSIIIGEFEHITLSNPENPEDTIIITEGKFNINRATLND